MSISSEMRDTHKRFHEVYGDILTLGNKHSRGTERDIEENSTRDVTFSAPFVEIPVVVAGFADSVQAKSIVSAYAVSTTGFTIAVSKIGGGNPITRDVSWIATTSGNT